MPFALRLFCILFLSYLIVHIPSSYYHLFNYLFIYVIILILYFNFHLLFLINFSIIILFLLGVGGHIYVGFLLLSICQRRKITLLSRKLIRKQSETITEIDIKEIEKRSFRKKRGAFTRGTRADQSPQFLVRSAEESAEFRKSFSRRQKMRRNINTKIS